MKYNDYLKTGWWLAVSEERKRDAQYRCEICGGVERLEVHHLRYEDEDGNSILGHEAMNDLEVLCRRCHLMVELAKLLRGKDVA